MINCRCKLWWCNWEEWTFAEAARSREWKCCWYIYIYM